jgi:hypothetical protein
MRHAIVQDWRGCLGWWGLTGFQVRFGLGRVYYGVTVIKGIKTDKN